MPQAVYDDEDQAVDPRDVAADVERRRLANATGGISEDEDDEFDNLTSDDHMAQEGQSGDLSGGRKSAGGTGTREEKDGPINKTYSDPDSKDENTRRGRLQNRLNAVRQRVGGAVGKLAKNKLLVGVGIGGSGILVIAIILIMLIMSALKVPHLMENVTAYRFARVFQRASVQNERTFKAKIAVSIADSKTLKKYNEKYAGKVGKAKDLYDKSAKWSPNRSIGNLGASGMKFNYENGWFKDRLTSVTINDKTIVKPKVSFTKGLIPGVKWANDYKFSKQLLPEINGAMRTNGVGVFVRGVAGEKLRKQLGVRFIAWKAGQYTGKSSKEAARELIKTKAEAEKTSRLQATGTQVIDDGTSDVEDAKEKALQSTTELDEAAEKGYFPGAKEALDRAGEESIFAKGLAAVNTTYAIAAPLCIIYEGSITKAGPTIDKNSQAESKAYYHYASAADQIKDGTTVSPEAVRAYDDNLGPDINSSAPIQYANGNDKASTSGFTGPQRSGTGSFTAFNAMFGGDSGTADLANGAADALCPVLTDTKVAIGIAALSIGTDIVGTVFTGPGWATAKTTIQTLAERGVSMAAKKAALKLAVNSSVKAAGRAKTLLLKEGAKAGALVGTTLLAKMIVANRAALFSADGSEKGNDAVMAIDSGADLVSNELSRTQQFGAPMNKQDVLKNKAETTAYMNEVNQEKSAFDRYFATSNPQSLFSKLGMTTYYSLNRSFVGSMTNGLQSLLSPSFFGNKIAAVATPNAGADVLNTGVDYGNLQWGWTNEEIKLSKKPTYQFFENQRVLDESGREDEIIEKYGECFSLETSQGTLLSEERIVLDDSGNVTNGGGDDACSPQNLGPHNPIYQDLVFRYRLAQADNADLDEKINLETVTKSTTSGTSGGSEFTIASLNIFHSDDQPESVWGKRLDRSMAALTSNSVGIAGLQEVRPNQNKAISTGAHGSSMYDIYPSASSTASPDFSPNPIIWDKAKFTKVSTSGMPFLYFGRSKDTAPVVKLRDNSTSQEFYVINIHHPADTRGEASGIRHEDAEMNAEFIKKLGEEGLPIFFTGDFNNRYTTIDSRPGNDPLDNKCENLTYVIMSNKSGLWDAYDAERGKSEVTCPTTAPDSGNIVDHIFLSKSITQVTYKNLGDSGRGNNGSDVHNTILAHVVIPGSEVASSNAGTSFRIASYNVRVGAPLAWRDTSSKTMKANNFDVVGMQELEHADDYREMKSRLEDTYSLFPNVAGTERNNIAARTIAFKKDKFELVKSDEVTFVRMGGQDHQPAHAPVIWLKDKQTGQVIIVMNTHNPAYGPNANPPSGTGRYNGNLQRFEAGKNYVKKIQEISSEGLPIFFTGDFNEGDGVSGGTYRGRAQNLNYCQLTATGLMKDSEHDFLNKPDSNYCTDSSSARGGAIDRIYVSKSVQVKKFARLSGNLGTDHAHVPYADVVVPKTATTSSDAAANSGGTVVPSDITSVKNMRDAGKATGVIKEGLLYRSATLSTLSATDANKLSQMLLGKNGTIIDLRSTRDRAYAKDRDVPEVTKIGPLGIPATIDYTNFVDNKVDRQGFSTALKQIANANGPVLVHCTGGNDRTGWTVAMIMYTLGASDKQVMTEYLKSPVVPRNGSWLYNGLNDVQRKFGTPGKKNYHDAVMKYMTTSIDKGGLGLSSQTISNLKNGLGA